MSSIYRPFRPARSVREYGYDADGPIVQDGTPSGFILPWEAIDDQAEAVVMHRPPAFVVTGEHVRDDGVRFAEIGVTTGHIESTTNYRWDEGAKKLRLVCPLCGFKDGKHEKGCAG